MKKTINIMIENILPIILIIAVCSLGTYGIAKEVDFAQTFIKEYLWDIPAYILGGAIGAIISIVIAILVRNKDGYIYY